MSARGTIRIVRYPFTIGSESYYIHASRSRPRGPLSRSELLNTLKQYRAYKAFYERVPRAVVQEAYDVIKGH